MLAAISSGSTLPLSSQETSKEGRMLQAMKDLMQQQMQMQANLQMQMQQMIQNLA